jgi:hypothetical protein
VVTFIKIVGIKMNINTLNIKLIVPTIQFMQSNELNDDEKASAILLMATFIIKYYAKSHNIDETQTYEEFIRHLGELMEITPDVVIRKKS